MDALKIPNHKKGNKFDLSDYMPIAFLPILSKLFERFINQQLRDYPNGVLASHNLKWHAHACMTMPSAQKRPFNSMLGIISRFGSSQRRNSATLFYCFCYAKINLHYTSLMLDK